MSVKMPEYIWNPKTQGSGIVTCIPQTGTCPNNCEDCFFQSSRSYLEPLDKNLPQIPPKNFAEGRIVRMNDGNDSNVQRELVEKTAQQFKDYFFNTAIPKDLAQFSGPVVLTVNPGKMTDTSFHKLDPPIPDNLMFVRVRTNAWNLSTIVDPVVKYYTSQGVVVVLTFMAYYRINLPSNFADFYVWKKRTLNSYWCLTAEAIANIEDTYQQNPLVCTCGRKGQYSCSLCGGCIREYYNAKERMCGAAGRFKI